MLAVPKAVRKHISCLAPLCAPQFVRDGTVVVIQRARREEECGRQGTTLISATICLTFWSKMQELLVRANSDRSVMGFISCPGDFTVSPDDDEADRLWDETCEVPKESGLEVDQSKSCYGRSGTTEHSPSRRRLSHWALRRLERNSTAVDEHDESLIRGRLEDAYEFAGNVEAITQLHLGTRKTEPLWLVTSKSIARAVDFDAKVVSPKKLKPLAETPEAKTRDICEKLIERFFDDDWTIMQLPTSLCGMGGSEQKPRNWKCPSTPRRRRRRELTPRGSREI